MMEASERWNTKARQAEHGMPTTYKTQTNRYPLHCGLCGELYYLDETALRSIHSALERDPANIPFYCEACEQDWSEEAYGHG